MRPSLISIFAITHYPKLMQPPSHNDPQPNYEYLLVIRHSSQVKVMLARDGDGGHWKLPSFVPEVLDFRQVGHINEAARALLGMETFVVRCLQHRSDAESSTQYRYYLLTTRRGEDDMPEYCRWFNAHELEDLPQDGVGHVETVRSFLRESEGSAPERRVPWAATGWFDEAMAWIYEQLRNEGLSATGQAEQLRAWSLSCLLRLPTSEGDLYFKAVPPFFRGEPAVMRAVAERYPEIVPHPLAVDVEKGWTLMRDFGGRWLGEVSDVTAWEDSARAFAGFQVEQSKLVESWQELGCPDRGLKTLAELMDTLFDDRELLTVGAPWGISQEEQGRLRALSLRLKLMCARLADYKVPHTLVHGDLGGNIIVKEDGFVFFDWTDSCISHPFIDTTTMITTVFDELELPIGFDELKTRVRDAYLQPWSEFEPMERLIEAFELSQPLGALHQAMTYAWLISSVAEDARWELQAGLTDWLRQLLNMMGSAQESEPGQS